MKLEHPPVHPTVIALITSRTPAGSQYLLQSLNMAQLHLVSPPKKGTLCFKNVPTYWTCLVRNASDGLKCMTKLCSCK